jgi:hypothetical protein
VLKLIPVSAFRMLQPGSLPRALNSPPPAAEVSADTINAMGIRQYPFTTPPFRAWPIGQFRNNRARLQRLRTQFTLQEVDSLTYDVNRFTLLEIGEAQLQLVVRIQHTEPPEPLPDQVCARFPGIETFDFHY